MKKSFALILLSLGFCFSCSSLKSVHQTQAINSSPDANTSQPVSLPSGRGTPAEAKAMTLKAIEYYGAVGRDKALADFTKMKSPFGDRDLYVVCIGSDRKISANGGYAQFVGSSADVLKDADGKSLGQAIWDATWNSGEGTVDYKWTNPVSKVTERKIGYFRKVGEDVCGVSAYTE